jgi:hypothetical protein
MPCYQPANLPSGFSTTGRTSYKTEAECNQACQEGACCDGTACTVTRACRCQGAGKVFQGVGTVCAARTCSRGECPEQISAGDMPASFTMQFNQKPSIKVHGCNPAYYPNDTTLDLDGSYAEWTDPNTGQPTNTPTRYGRVVARSGWQPLDVFSENQWSSSVVLTKQPTFPGGVEVPSGATVFYSNGGSFAGETTLSAGVWVRCAYANEETGRPVWEVLKAYASMPSYLRLTSTWFNRYFVRDPVWTITSSQLIWASGATVNGDSASGFSVSSANGIFNQFEALPAVLIPCSPNPSPTPSSSAVISAISVTLAENPLP